MCTDRGKTCLRVLPRDLAYKRTEPSAAFFLFSFLASTRPASASHTAMLSSLPLSYYSACFFLASAVTRNVSERYTILTQRLHSSITPSLLHTLAVMSPPSSPSTWALYVYLSLQVNAFRCKSMQEVAARSGRDQACQSAVTSPFLFHVPRISGGFRRSRGTRMRPSGSRGDESDPTLSSLH
jgi:hypothetical protein